MFSESGLKEMFVQEKEYINENENKSVNIISIDKLITLNDIRARIISVPRDILKMIPEDVDKIEITINDEKEVVSVRRDRSYFAGVTNIFKKYGLILEDGTYCPIKAKWVYSKNGINVYIKQ